MAEQRHVEFLEGRGDPKRREGHLVVAGWCSVGPIRLGDRFTSLVDRNGVEHEVALGLTDIGFYGGYTFELDPMLSGELVLFGDVDPQLLVGATLRGSMSGKSEDPCGGS